MPAPGEIEDIALVATEANLRVSVSVHPDKEPLVLLPRPRHRACRIAPPRCQARPPALLGAGIACSWMLLLGVGKGACLAGNVCRGELVEPPPLPFCQRLVRSDNRSQHVDVCVELRVQPSGMTLSPQECFSFFCFIIRGPNIAVQRASLFAVVVELVTELELLALPGRSVARGWGRAFLLRR